MDKIVAYCGLVCTDCEAYIATQADDLAALERMAERTREEFGIADATTESVKCDGCLTDDGRQIGYCAQCQIRACGVARGVVNCAYCDDYPVDGEGCQKLLDWFEQVPQSQPVLESIRKAL